MDGVELSCPQCSRHIWLCRSCWRNHTYCSTGCATLSKQQFRRESQAKYAKTPKGRESQRRRDYTYRTKQTATDASSKVESKSVNEPLKSENGVCGLCGRKIEWSVLIDQLPSRSLRRFFDADTRGSG